MTCERTVIVTGAAGYIGTVVADALLHAGWNVVGLDSLMYGPRSLLNLLSSPRFWLRRVDLTDHAAVLDVLGAIRPSRVVHLAAIVGDPACRARPELARRVNLDATNHLFEVCGRVGVERFIFASTCSNYGLSEDTTVVSEESPLRPLSLYAETKVAAEQWIEANAGSCQGIVLRFATAHGLSPRMRFDLTVNEFTRMIVERKPIELYDATTWRPYCHVLDFGRVIAECCSSAALAEPFHVMNVGSNAENYRKLDIVEKVARATSIDANIVDVGEGRDRRNYRVSFEKLARTLGFAPRYDVAFTAAQIAEAIATGLFDGHPEDMKYGNV
jgi:nucleoside-diphosphate-sugar epimerase